MASLKLSDDNRTKRIQELLSENIQLSGEAKIAQQKHELSQMLTSKIIGETDQRKAHDYERALREEMTKKKEKQAKENGQSQGPDPALASVSEVRPVNGDPGRGITNIANPQQGVGKTGPGGTLTSRSGLGSTAFNVPDQITTTENRVVGGDRGQRGALIRQGPIFEQTQRTTPNVLTAGDALAAHQRQNEYDRNFSQKEEEFEFDKEIKRSSLQSQQSSDQATRTLALNRDSREMREFNTKTGVFATQLNEQLHYDYPNLDDSHIQGIVDSTVNGNLAQLSKLTKDLPESVSRHMKDNASAQSLEKERVLIEKAKAETFKARMEGNKAFNPQVALLRRNGIAGGLDPITGSGLPSEYLETANDPVLTRQLRTSVRAFTKAAFDTSGKLKEQFLGDLGQLQQDFFARGQLYLVKSGGWGWGEDARTSMNTLEPIAKAMEQYIAGSDPKSGVSKKDAARAKDILVHSGIAELDGTGIRPTEHNDIAFDLLVTYGTNRAAWRAAYGESSGNVAVTPAAPDVYPQSVDMDEGIPLTAAERNDKIGSRISEVNQVLMDPHITSETRRALLEKKENLRKKLFASRIDGLQEAAMNRQAETAKRMSKAQERAADVLNKYR